MAKTAEGSYFGEKTHQVSTHTVTAFGIDITSRYAKAGELSELLAFAQATARMGRHHLVKEAFYDSKACCCSFEFTVDINQFGTDAQIILAAARETISQFDWFGMVEHGGINRNPES